MDPLTALGLASNVFSFVSFASGLIKGTIEISASADGCTIDVTKLDTICEQLQNLCDGLESCSQHQILEADDDDHVVKVLVAVQGLCKACKADGNELLRITKKLRTKNDSTRKWDSFQVALRKAWKKTSIDELEARLSRTQVTYCNRAQSDRLELLQRRSLSLQSNQAEALNRISLGLVELQTRVREGQDAANFNHQPRSFTRDDVDCLQAKLQSLSLSGQTVAKQQAILDTLTFESRPVRHAQIVTAHEKTFSWALKTDRGQARGPCIGDWLKTGEGIFWVSGKPGSGKSTLMKYIADSKITSRLITTWAQPGKAVIASHYFWIAGTSMQKSQQGLLQTLLYDIFRQCPHLIDQTCVERWACSQPAGSWSLNELHEALKTVATRGHNGLKFCFIIDGMDEYSGDHEDRVQLCKTFKDLAKSGNIKLFLSSRPWNVFEEEFGLQFPKVYMQDLTRGDIESFVTARLQEHPRWAAISVKHSQGQWLISEIAAKSNGVFLWVFLVTKLLREGLTNRDTFADLRRRLQSFPSELESFFKTILEGVEPFYHSHMSTALQLASASTESPMSFLAYSFHFQEYEDPDYAINHAVRVMDHDEIQEIKSNTSWHLASRTRGLLEVHSDDGSVTFLHRTARDFLNTQEMHDFLVAKTDASLNFLPALSLLRAHIALIKTSSIPHKLRRTSFGKFHAMGDPAKSQHLVLELLPRALKYAGELESRDDGDLRHHALLDELDRSLLSLFSRSTCKFVPRYWSNSKQVLLREQLVQFGLFNYLQSKLDVEPTFLRDIGTLPVLRFLQSDPTNGSPLQHGRGTDVLAYLLENQSLDLNKVEDFESISPWNALLAHICHWRIVQRKNATCILSFLLEKRILKRFLEAGADPDSEVEVPDFTFDSHRGGTAPLADWQFCFETHSWVEVPASTSDSLKTETASVVYLQFCFDVLYQSPSIQELYLDVLTNFLRLSHADTLRLVCMTFRDFMDNRSKYWVHRDFLFYSKVNNILLMGLGHRPETAETRRFLTRVATRIFPSNLYVPLETTTSKSRKGKRKRMTE
ncbi:hypothetical protein diail_1950 [Diaporthe ilicicola]|nr:hypothetical protein diail_1950 [Diaporthe ilicicola]